MAVAAGIAALAAVPAKIVAADKAAAQSSAKSSTVETELPGVQLPSETPQTATNANADGVPIRGVVRASAQAQISTDLVAAVSRIWFKAGEKFKTGEVLLSFDCARQKAEIRAAAALLKEVQVSLRSALALQSGGAGAKADVDVSRARVDRASAELEAQQHRVKQCDIVAPFDGSVVDSNIREHEFSVSGKPLLSIVSTRSPDIELVVPSRWLSWLTPGTEFEFFVEENQVAYRAKVQRLGAAADTVSQTLKVYAAFVAMDPPVLPGSSGIARFGAQEG